MNSIIKNALFNAFGTTGYIVLISSFLFYVPKMLGPMGPDTVFAPIMMLSLLVFSVAMVGSLIFGRPILWYWDGKKQEAIMLLVATLGIFFVITILVACAFLLFS